MEHALHLAAKHFVTKISPTPTSALVKKIRSAITDSDGGPEDLDIFNDDLEALELANGCEAVDLEGFDTSDVIGKALSLVTQV
jgi:hypothetical protein